eukprot:scpid90254/ scgid14143/ 
MTKNRDRWSEDSTTLSNKHKEDVAPTLNVQGGKKRETCSLTADMHRSRGEVYACNQQQNMKWSAKHALAKTTHVPETRVRSRVHTAMLDRVLDRHTEVQLTR